MYPIIHATSSFDDPSPSYYGSNYSAPTLYLLGQHSYVIFLKYDQFNPIYLHTLPELSAKMMILLEVIRRETVRFRMWMLERQIISTKEKYFPPDYLLVGLGLGRRKSKLDIVA